MDRRCAPPVVEAETGEVADSNGVPLRCSGLDRRYVQGVAPITVILASRSPVINHSMRSRAEFTPMD